MGTEIERKFLVANEHWRAAADAGKRFRQGYLSVEKQRTVRVRMAGARGLLTIKGIAEGNVRPEYEYDIPAEDAEQMLDALCLRPLIEKTRFRVPHGGLLWEVDVFEGANAGLVLAEVELETADQHVDLPEWTGEEVTGDPRYYNANLIDTPYTRW